MRFDWTDLQVFLHVCEAGSMTAAAERCHLTLAAVSARMRGLEEANGVVLLSRQPRGVSPTAAGSVLARHARLVFDQVQRLERDLVHVREAPARPFVLLANSSALARPLAAALTQLPDRPVLVRESPSEATVRAIRSGAADLGIVSDAVDTRGMVSHDLGPDPLVLVLAREHAFVRRESVHFKEALQLPWIAWGEQSALSTHLLMHAAAFDTPLQPRITYPAVGGVLQLVARGLGVTVLPAALVHQHGFLHEIACVPLEDGWAQRRLLACHSVDGDPTRHQLAERIALEARGSWRSTTRSGSKAMGTVRSARKLL